MSDIPYLGSLDEKIQRLAADGEVDLAADGKTPIARDRRLAVNGAAVVEQSHEYVIRKNNAQS